MPTLKDLLAEQKKLDEQRVRLEKQVAAARRQEFDALRQQILKLAKDHGTTIEELFGKGAGRKKGGTRKVTLPKYWSKGAPVDGRSARRMSAFEAVMSGGKIDDRKALAAGMINPEWLGSKKPAARAFVKAAKVDVKGYKAQG